MRGVDSDVVDDRDSHVGMGLQTKYHDRSADEEYRDNADTLSVKCVNVQCSNVDRIIDNCL